MNGVGASKPIKHAGDVYYDSNTKMFLQLRRHRGRFLDFSGFCDFAEETKTTTREQELLHSYLDKLTRVKD